MNYISNAFSFNMIGHDKAFDLLVTPVSSPDEYTLSDGSLLVAMSNQATCDLFNLHSPNLQVSPTDTVVSLAPGDSMLVMQYNGPRLEKGLTSIPAGGNLRFFIVEVESPVFM